MKSFEELVVKAKKINNKPRIVVPCPYDKNTLQALDRIKHENIGDIILVGNKDKLYSTIEEHNLNILPMKFIEIESDEKALEESFNMIIKNEADIIVKGMVQTKYFMKTILSDKEFIKKGLLTHVSIFEITHKNKLLFVSDPSIIIEPTLEQKKIIIDNALELLKHLEIEAPKVAIVSSTEVPNESIKSSMDAKELTRLQKEMNIWDAQVYGPLAIDNAVSLEAAHSKNIDNVVAGNADLLIMPNLDAGNIFCKGLVYIGGLKSAGIVLGACKPIVLTSRSAGVEERFNSICVACLLADKII